MRNSLHAGCVHVTFGVGINPEYAVHGKLIGVAAKICNTLSSHLHPVRTLDSCMDRLRNGGIPSGFRNGPLRERIV